MARAADQVYDELLVLRCASGDRAALAELIERWQPRRVGYATRLTGRPDVAVDAVQETGRPWNFRRRAAIRLSFDDASEPLSERFSWPSRSRLPVKLAALPLPEST
jgi:hypothetical protein